jgi:hypothetical protein
VDTIPDIFRTASNVTGQLAAGAIVARGGRAPASEVTLEPSAAAAPALDAAIPATVLVDD